MSIRAVFVRAVPVRAVLVRAVSRLAVPGSLLLTATAALSCASDDAEQSNVNDALASASMSGAVTANVAPGTTSGTPTPNNAVPSATLGNGGMAPTTSTGGSTATGDGGSGSGGSSSAGSGGSGSSLSEPMASEIPSSGGGSGGVLGTAGVGGAMDIADGGEGSGGASAGAANGGGGGMSGSGTGGDGMGGASGDEDMVPPRPLDVTASAGRHEHRFRALQADPEVSFNDNNQIAIFDNRAATLMGKLVLTFGGAGQTEGNLTGGGEFCAQRGFHVLAVAAFQAYNIVIHGPDFYGDARRTVFEGVMHTRDDEFANIEMTPADGVARRTQKALEYLHAMYPEEDWGYYLQEDGSVRWSDVIFTGVSHGASNSARFASLVRASRVVSIAGPRDNLCERVDLNDCGGEVATWLSEVPKTPIDRFYAITGVQDDQHTQHLFAMEKLGYLGQPTSVNGAQPPYGESHRLVSSGGHDDFCGQAAYQDACNYAFGVPPENHTGTGP